jgi:hypothetical protein
VLWKLLSKRRQEAQIGVHSRRGDPTLQAVLWTLWTIAVAVTAYLSWHADVIAQRPINLLGLAIHSVVTGLIGLVVLTVVEMRVEPWRFTGEE